MEHKYGQTTVQVDDVQHSHQKRILLNGIVTVHRLPIRQVKLFSSPPDPWTGVNG